MQTDSSSISLLVYNILNPRKKISFAYKFLVQKETEYIDLLLSEFVQNISKSEFKPSRRNTIIFMAKPLGPGNIVNVLMSKNEIHINSGHKKSIDQALNNICYTGMILKSIKNKKNKLLFPMRFYKSYEIINFGSIMYPINNN